MMATDFFVDLGQSRLKREHEKLPIETIELNKPEMTPKVNFHSKLPGISFVMNLQLPVPASLVYFARYVLILSCRLCTRWDKLTRDSAEWCDQSLSPEISVSRDLSS